MPLDLYVDDNRRRADGYRYNNNDILAISLDYYINQAETCFFDDEFADDDDDDNIVSSDETVEEQKYEGPARPLEELKNHLPKSGRNRE